MIAALVIGVLSAVVGFLVGRWLAPTARDVRELREHLVTGVEVADAHRRRADELAALLDARDGGRS